MSEKMENKLSSSQLVRDCLITQLSAGLWTFDLIYPSFRAALLSQLRESNFDECQASDVSTLALCCARYRPNEIFPSTLKRMSTRPILNVAQPDADEIAFWKTAVLTANVDSRFNAITPFQQSKLNEAVEIIRVKEPATYRAFNQFIFHLVPFENSTAKSFSHPHFYGCIFMDVTRPSEELALSIVHEMAHQELFLINLLDRLILTGADYRLAHAPFQGKERPPIGRLHSAHALFRMIRFELAVSSSKATSHSALLLETVATFRPDELTPFAQSICKEIYAQNLARFDGYCPMPFVPEVELA